MNLAGLVPLGLCHLPVCRQAGHVLPSHGDRMGKLWFLPQGQLAFWCGVGK